MEAEVTMRAALTLIVVFQISRMQAVTFPSKIKWVESKMDHKPKAYEEFNQELVYLDDLSCLNCAAQCSNRANCSSFFCNEGLITGNCILSASVYINTLHVTTSQAEGFVYYEINNDGCPVNDCYHQLRQEDLCLFLHDVGKEMSYTESDRLCKSVSGHLAVLDEEKKSAAVFEFLKINSGVPRVYVDAIRENGSFKWANGKTFDKTDPFWLSGEPDYSNEKCVLMTYRQGKFGGADVRCNSGATYVLCEKD